MTTVESDDATRDAAVRAATERWARAAGVPVSVAEGAAPDGDPGAGTRFLRGLLIGCAVGALLLWPVTVDGPTALVWVLLALGTGFLLAATTPQRSVARRPARSQPVGR
ncbi:hypothetical protein [Blastococcus montanus]|uniref:hypothetical protein n=1 Tax=Blastococcus montanus TaxID=3144973 RepID=UPI00320795E9